MTEPWERAARRSGAPLSWRARRSRCRLWSELIRVGIDEEEVGEQLEEEGVQKFAASYQAALETVEAKAAQAAR